MNLASPCAQQRPERWDLNWPDRRDERWNDVCVGEEQFQTPFVGKDAAEEVFGYLREKKEGVAIWVGDWRRAWDGALYIPAWFEQKNAKVVCSVGEGDADTQRGGKVDGWCEVEVGKEYWEHY